MVHTDRGDLSAPIVVDALGWRRVLGSGYQPPEAPLSRGLEVHPWGVGDDMELWIDRKYVPAGYGWSFPAGDETRIGVGSFDPRFHVKDTTVMLAEDLSREPVRYQGNWIPHRLRAATDDGVFFVGDSAGHCLPLTAEGIRTALYFGIACGRELRAVVEGRQPIASALARYGDFSEAHRWKFEAMLAAQRLVPRVPPRLLHRSISAMQAKRFVDWSFGHYLGIAPPDFVAAGPPPRGSPAREQLAAWTSAISGCGSPARCCCRRGLGRRRCSSRRGTRALAGPAVVAVAGLHRGAVEVVHGPVVGRRECHVKVLGQVVAG